MSALRERVADARRERVTVVAGDDDDTTLPDAYEIQRALFAGRELAGYKLGLVSPAKRAQMGQDAPVYGHVAAEMVLTTNVVALDALIQPRFEPEIAVVLRRDVPPGSSAGSVVVAIGATFLAVDVLDSVWRDYRFSLPQVVADNTSGGAFVLGEHAYDAIPSGRLDVRLDGDVVGSGSLADIGDPVAHLQWLADDVGGLRAGQVIFLGSPTAAVDARPGLLELDGPDGVSLSVRLQPSA
jgi:2-oxo-3-hexenedioate decarboxylase